MEETVIRPASSAGRPPRTIMEVFRMLPETTLAEVINETLYMSPAPIGKHQRTIRKLISQMAVHTEANGIGEIFVSPFDVFLDEHSNAVQPDLFYISINRLDMVDDDGGVHGVPDLIIEILSPGNPKYDLETKKDLYEKFGVKEYWIVNPSNRETLGYSLLGRKYGQPIETTGIIISTLLDHTFTF